mgnify:CR=1 FL=1
MNHRYRIYTTVDITPTGVINNSNKNTQDYHLKRNQQRNYDTLCQVISLRANIHNPTVTERTIRKSTRTFPNPALPEEYKIWTMGFWCDHDMVFGESHQALCQDLNMVPIVPNLTETVPQFPPYFITIGDFRNVYIS